MCRLSACATLHFFPSASCFTHVVFFFLHLPCTSSLVSDVCYEYAHNTSVFLPLY